MLIPVRGSERFANRPIPASEVLRRLPQGFRLHTVDKAASDRIDPLTYEVIRHRLWAITEEMADAVRRMSGSIVVIECNDFNTCIMDEVGDVVQMGLYCTQLTAGIDMSVKWTLENRAANPGIADGDMFLTNDPWIGGGAHQSDVAVFAPVFWEGELFAWTNAVSHQLDIGGVAAGSWTPKSKDVFWESLPTPPIKIFENGELRADAEDAYLRRSRVPRLLALDLRAQIGANRVAVERIKAVIAKYGPQNVKAVMRRVLDDGESQIRNRLHELPDGKWSAVAYQDQAREGDRGAYKIVCTMTKQNDQLIFDFRGTDPEVEGLINCTYAGLRSGVLVMMLTELCGDIPWAPGGILRCVEIITEEGTLNNCRFPAGISRASIASSWATQTAVGECIAAMLETHETHRRNLIAVSCGSFDLVLMSGVDQYSNPFVTLLGDCMAGGLGARVGQDGVDTGGMQNIVQARIPDVEMNEFTYPILYLWRREEPDSGGPGRFRGGDGGSSCFILHDTPARQMNLTVSSTGKAFPQATGMSGGYPANTAYDVMFRNSTLRDQLQRTGLPRKLSEIDGQPEFIQVAVDSYMDWDDVYYTHWQGGGGYGDPLMREPASVAKDVAEGKVTPQAAREVYGVILIKDLRADEEATRLCRQEFRSTRGAVGMSEPFPVDGASLPDGRILDDNLLVDKSGNTCCKHCGIVVGTADGQFLSKAHRREGLPALAGPQIHGDPAHFVDEKIVFRHVCCPTCFASLLTEIVPVSDRGYRVKTLARQGAPPRAAKE
jgi:N-methylhydantoinase B